MSLILHVILYLSLAWIVFNVVYFGIVHRYFHTRAKYRLFALRDRLRRLRVDYPSLDPQIYKMMELRVNGAIGVLKDASLHRLFFAIFAGSFTQEEKDRAAEMEKTIEYINDNRNTELGAHLFDIDNQVMDVFYKAFRHNSPIGIVLLVYFIVPFFRSLPRIYGKIKQFKDSVVRETVPAMLVNAAK